MVQVSADPGYHPAAGLTIHVLPPATGSTVHLPEDARESPLEADGQLHALDCSVRRVSGVDEPS